MAFHQHEPQPKQAMKACVECKSQIRADASLCSVCKSHQRDWQNWLQYFAGVATLITLSVSASFWLYQKIRSTYFYRENVGVVACNTLLRTVVIANRGDRDVFVTRLQLWMPGRTSDWQSPYLEINQSVAPGQFLKAEFPKTKLENGEVVRGLSQAEFDALVRKAANYDPCLELDFFAGDDTHVGDIVLMAGPTLNQFRVQGNLEYVGARQNIPVKIPLGGIGIVRRDLSPACKASPQQSKPGS